MKKNIKRHEKSMQKIFVASRAGFCFGVKNAVDTAVKCAGQENCYLLGDIIHNKSVVDRLAACGLKKIDSVSELRPLAAGERGKVIIRSHGADRKTYEDIAALGYEIVDATCPFVVKIHEIVKEHYESGFHIVIIGEAKHPEVVATSGWCDNTATIISDEKDLIGLEKYEKLCFVCQTTFDGKKFEELSKKYTKSKLKRLKFSTRFAILHMSVKQRRYGLPKSATSYLSWATGQARIQTNYSTCVPRSTAIRISCPLAPISKKLLFPAATW